MLDKARLAIIASVPLTMAFNLSLLNRYYSPSVERNNIKESINTNRRKNYYIEEEKKEKK